MIVEHIFNIPTVLKLADTVWTLSNGKMTISKADALFEKNSIEDHSIHDFLHEIAGNSGSIETEELPNGARLTTASSSEHKNAQVALDVIDLTVKRGIRTVFNGLSFNLKKGQISILEAPNGWGKSTLLDAISGICPVEAGEIMFNGQNMDFIPTHRRVKMGLAYLRSQESPFTSLSVEENKKLANTSNYLFNSAMNSNAKASYLSGGERQKLLIEMLPEADVYLLDEPMFGLDEEAIGRISEWIIQMVNEEKSILITMPESRVVI